jgi:hypothetical protein
MSRRLLGSVASLGCAVMVILLQVSIATAGVRSIPEGEGGSRALSAPPPSLGYLAQDRTLPNHPGVASLTSVRSGPFLAPAAGDPPKVPTPPWWHGLCDSGYNSHFVKAGSWDGLIACGPGGTFRLESESGSPLKNDWEWQCTELSKRWLYQEFGLPTLKANGYQIVNQYATYLAAHPGAAPLKKVTPQSASSGSLGPGDVVSFADVNGDNGHTNVVTSTNPAPFDGNGSVTTLNENKGGFVTLSVKNWKFGMKDLHGNYMAATGWLHTTAAAHPGSWTAAEAPHPPNWWGNSEMATVKCPSATTCVAVGYYIDTSQNDRGLVLTGSGASRTTSELPAPANAGWFAAPDVLACTSSTSCVAAGYYIDSSSHQQGLLLTESSSGWVATEAPLPANAAANPNVSLASIACPSTTMCLAAGTYTDSSGNVEGLLLTRSGTSWTTAEAPLPSNAAANPRVSSETVSCPTSTGCAVAAYYFGTSGLSQALLLWGLGTSWATMSPPLPANGVKNRESELESAYCLPGSSCVATGFYSDSSGTYGNTHGLLLTGSGTSWKASEAPTPASTSEVQVTDVTCASISACFATGIYLDGASNNYRGFLLTGSATSWTAAEEPVPVNASTGTGDTLRSLTCPFSAACVAVGGYTDSSGHDQPLVITGYGTSWTATQAPVPAGAATVPGPSLGSVACTSTSACIAVGSYLDTASSSWQGLLDTGPA